MLAQKTNTTLRSEIDALKKENVTLKLQLKSQKNGSDSTTASKDDIKRSITRWAKFFQLFYFSVLTIDSFKTQKPDFAPDNPKCYEGDNARLGPTAELHPIIPQKFMAYMIQFDALAKHVSEIVHSQFDMTSDALS